MTEKVRERFVVDSTRRPIARQQPPHGDRRTKRNRTRGDQKRRALREEY